MAQNNKLFYRGSLRKYLQKERFEVLKRELHVITMESAFVVRTFFFVIFGLSIVVSNLLNFRVLEISLILLVSIYAIRWLLLRAFIGIDIFPQIWIAPRGLITVLLYYAIPQEYSNESFDPGILLFIIISTSIIMSWGLIHSAIVQDIPLIINPIVEEETIENEKLDTLTNEDNQEEEYIDKE
ncbi:MAG: NhaP-type Na+/H+ or K+/H+ antiporter [Ancylomarina sp.]